MIRALDPVKWRDGRLNVLPLPWKKRALKGHDKRGGVHSAVANLWLLDMSERMEKLRVPIDLTDGEIRAMAETCAREALNRADGLPRTMEAARQRMAIYCNGYGISAPEPVRVTASGKRVGVEDGPAIKRMTCALWWRRRLRVAQGRALEREAIGLGIVHKHAEPYASNATIQRRTEQRQRNALTMESTTAHNLTTGQEYQLSDLVARSNSNPRIRRGELMTRLSGFEQVANALGHVAEFVTLTCPSKYHAMKTSRGGSYPNPKYAGFSPREGQRYLVKVWSRIRAKFGRYGIRTYGFRVAEPHADATPHWHMVLFMPAWFGAGRAMRGRFRAIFRRYALAEDGSESGARKNRIEFEAISAEKGGACAYLAKYISKNIDGYQVQQDFETGKDAVTSAPRVEAWASTWSIRQFQQIGGAPVGVWRELRKMEEGESHTVTVRDARTAADCGGRDRVKDGKGCGTYWADYTRIQGGPTVKRDDLALRTAYSAEGERIDGSTGEIVEAPKTRYDEVAKGAVFGVRDVRADRAFVSRFFQWEIRRGANVSVERNAGWIGCGDKSMGGDDRGAGEEIKGRSKGCGAVEDYKGCGSDVDGKGVDFDFPWTRVNNCTQVARVEETRAEKETRESFEAVDWVLWRAKHGVFAEGEGIAGGGGAISLCADDSVRAGGREVDPGCRDFVV